MAKRIAFTLFAVVLIVGALSVALLPPVRDKADSATRRLQTWWSELQPHDQFVPAPPADAGVVVELATPSNTPAPTVAPTARPTAAPTRLPGQPTAAPTATAVPKPTAAPPPPEVKLVNFHHEYQGWNNCGPATLGMMLSHFGSSLTQKEIAPVLKPNTNDKNVSPTELTAFVQQQQNDLRAIYRLNGDVDLLKRLLANGFPVIVETWFVPTPNDGMGHYRLLLGYSESQQKFFALDSYDGPNVSIGYAALDSDWKVFNRTYVVAFPQKQREQINSLLGPAASDPLMWEQARARAQADVDANKSDTFGWFNLGDALIALGDPAGAVKAFDQARRLGLPWRMLWYQFEPFEAYLAAGRNQDVLDLTAANLKQAGDLEESFYYRGRALQAMGKINEAAASFREAVRLNGNYQAAAKALQSLPPAQ